MSKIHHTAIAEMLTIAEDYAEGLGPDVGQLVERLTSAIHGEFIDRFDDPEVEEDLLQEADDFTDSDDPDCGQVLVAALAGFFTAAITRKYAVPRYKDSAETRLALAALAEAATDEITAC